MEIIVLGAGLVGGPLAIDLAQDSRFEVSAVDMNLSSLERLKKHSIALIQTDLFHLQTICGLVEDYDLVVNAVPGSMGYSILKTLIQCKKNVVDISFFPEDPFLLHDLAKKNDVTAIVDCGVSPGISNLLIGHVDTLLDKTENILLYVGGLPKERVLPWEYKAGFSPADVIEEYVRPARMVENYKVVSKPALSEPEYIDFEEVGMLEAFNSDGIRTLIRTVNARNMKEKTLRYPGHIDKLALLRDSGFFDLGEMDLNGARVTPRDVTARILFPQWEMGDGDEDFTVMRLIISGTREGREVQYTYDLLDRYDEGTGTHSMARTTGFAATAAVRLLERGLYDRKGVSPPEFIGKHRECVDFMMADMKKRNITYQLTIEEK